MDLTSDLEPQPPEIVLSSDHPLLQRFQSTLKAHLLRVQAKLQEECAALDFRTKTLKDEQQDVGADLYDLQQQQEYQQRQLDGYLTDLKATTEARDRVDKEVVAARQEQEAMKLKMDELGRNYRENRINLENLTEFENHIEKWHKQSEDTLKVATRITKKDSQDRMAKIEEKRQIDLFVLSLESEVRRRENELNEINEQIQDTESVKEKFNKSLTDANSDLEALQQEHKRLMQMMREVIVSIQQRDKMLAEMHQELNQEYERQKDLKGHIDGTKKAIHSQSIENEKLEGFLNRLLGDLEQMERQILKENKEIEKIQETCAKKTAILEQTELDLKQSKMESLLVENHLKDIKKKIELQSRQKVKLEETILDLLQEQISSDKAGQFRAKILRDHQQNRRNTEIIISASENSLSALCLDMERDRGSVTRYKEIIEKFRQDETELTLSLNKQEDDLKAILTQITLNQRSLDVLTKQLEELRSSGLRGREVSPEENRILELKQNLTDLDEEMKNSQNFWLKLQNHLVNLNENRSSQQTNIFVARKQDFIIEQKYRKIEFGLEELGGDEKQLHRLIQSLNTKLDLLGTRIYEKVGKNRDKQEECERSFEKLYQNLKDTEKSLIELKEEITVASSDLETMKTAVIEKHREILTWEDKYRGIVELKRYQDEEGALEGEINSMKMEIHRMEIRYAQLKRAQEKLMQDMDNCVMHREKIFTKSLVYEKVNRNSRRNNFEDKIASFKQKIRQIQQEILLMEKSVKELNCRHNDLEKDLQAKTQEIDFERDKDEEMVIEIEEGQLIKQANLDSIVRNQKRAKRYSAILSKETMPKIRSEASIDQLWERQKEVQDHLLAFLENLLNDFPDQKFVISKILQSLKNN